MALKLGEVLLKHGLITDSQLQEALRAQQLFGGRLGTNLVELGYVTEHGLARVLSAQLGIPAVDLVELDAIPPDAIAALPRELAEKFKVVPLQAQKRKLRIALSDPTDLKAMDEISFATNCSIVPVVAPEMLINFALEKYYGVARSTRYIKLAGPSEAEFQVVQTAYPSEESNAAPVPGNVKIEDRSQFLEQARSDFVAPAYAMTQMLQDLAGVSEQREVFEVLKRFLIQDFERLAIFVMRATTLVGWTQVKCVIPEGEFRKVSIRMGESAVMSRALESRTPFNTTFKGTPLDDWLAQNLGLKNRRDVLILPVAVNHQVVSVLVGDEKKTGTIADQLPAYAQLATKASYALQMAYLKKRILEA